jgi:hypothetical protein
MKQDIYDDLELSNNGIRSLKIAAFEQRPST